MGNVVKLESAGSKRAPAAGSRGAARRARARRPRTALVLGGGGLSGGVYQIGALRAIDLLAVNSNVNEFDVYVGTGAGAFVAACLANGLTPEELMRAVVQQVPAPFPDMSAGAQRLNYRELVAKGLTLPWKALRLLRALLLDPGRVSAVDVALVLAEALPSGLYTGEGLERYVERILSDGERSDDFRRLRRRLYLPAVDLDTCERIVFGSPGWDDVPISTAVRAASALPMLYRPVEVKGRELVDGGIVSTTNLDLAVQAGAKFIVVVNPLVPFVHDPSEAIPTSSGGRARRISEMGLPHVGDQVFRLLAYQRLHEMARRWEERYPGVDIILVEPDPDDELMFQASALSYARRVDIARHGFQSITVKLAHDYARFKRVCARHGIEISATRVRKVVSHFESEPEASRAWRKILEQTTSALLRQSSQD
jgi:NTE family protein